jgi:predicted AAA+ superfamily ATPase
MSPSPILYHWRVHGGSEVDLVLEWNGKIYPIEIKSASHPSKSDIRGIRIFKQTHKKLDIQKGLILCPCENGYPLASDVLVLPWDCAT